MLILADLKGASGSREWQARDTRYRNANRTSALTIAYTLSDKYKSHRFLIPPFLLPLPPLSMAYYAHAQPGSSSQQHSANKPILVFVATRAGASYMSVTSLSRC